MIRQWFIEKDVKDMLDETRSGAIEDDWNPAYSALREIWMLRCLYRVSPKILRKRLEEPSVLDGMLVDEMLAACGVDAEDQVDTLRAGLNARLEQRLAELPPRDGLLFEQLAVLGGLLDLTATETELCLFTTALHSDDELDTAFRLLGELNQAVVPQLLAGVLDQSLAAVHHALRAAGPLHRLGLVRWDRDASRTLRYQLDVLNGLWGLLVCEEDFETGLLRRYARPAPAGTLNRENFTHLGEDFSLLAILLDATARRCQAGINVLIHGPPGTGKTELVRTVARHCGFDLYEISSSDEDGDALCHTGRVQAFRLIQQVLARRQRCALLFDEAEDVFPVIEFDFWPSQRNNASGSKAWMNQLLESNPQPCFWISNTIRQIDPAFLRRFDLVLELDLPPRSVRERLLRRQLQGVPVSDAWLQRLAELDHLSPALIERTGRVARLLDDSPQREAQLSRVVTNTLRAMGLPDRATLEAAPQDYDPALLNIAGHDPQRLITGLARERRGRLCLHGPPGTGKSEFARYLARQLDQPVVCGRAAELLDMYVGGTEQNITRLFEQARQEQAVLLIDEIDGLLHDRNHARHSWEVTQVNELLTRMESFDGLLITTTNRLDGLDPAVLRRFDWKLKFDCLRSDQRRQLFRHLLGQPAGTLPTTVEQGLERLDNLTPGDFAVVRRKLRLLGPLDDPEALLDLLREESVLKPGATARPIGFVR